MSVPQKENEKVHIPPLKIQGIKTKLVPAILEAAECKEDTVWVEPFMGSGVVGFNAAPKKAVFGDTNPYIIQFYNDVKNKKITAETAREYLEKEAPELLRGDDEYYYEVRKRFNEDHDSLDFLFLNRACFNGLMRFNRKGEFNVPYCHKPGRFAKAYITKIVNQLQYAQELITRNDWQFICQPFAKTIGLAATTENAFIYCDPPYIGRNTDYYDSWNEENELLLKESLVASGKPFILSTWDHNKYRKNEYIDTVWGFCDKINVAHFYHVGAKEVNREAIVEALLVHRNI